MYTCAHDHSSPSYLDDSVGPVQPGDRRGLNGREDGKVGVEIVVVLS